jgi:Fe(3+) dicitrate transport protein
MGRNTCLALGGVLNAALSVAAFAQAAPDATRVTALPVITVYGMLPRQLQAIPGSSFVITQKDLKAANPYAVKDSLRGVPGLHVVDEDAFGLNLNIGIRGLDPRRTSRTLLLEDGMPIHLGPYSDPTAHYHTPLYRLDQVEVIKGSGQIIHGPQTVGGVINFVTTPVPRTFMATASGALGNRGYTNIDLSTGTGNDRGGILVQASRKEGGGVRDKSEHEVIDFSAKSEIDLTDSQTVTLKAGYYEETSNFSEAGTDQARFAADPRNNPFNDDTFALGRYIVQGTYLYRFSDDIRFSTNAYYQTLDRASYRQLDAISEDGENEILRSRAGPSGTPNIPGCPDDIDFTVPGGWEQFADACGNAMRPRSYEFFGIEPRLDARHTLFGVASETVAGLRYHSENIVRRRFNGASPDAREDSPGTYLRDVFNIDTDAFSAYAQNTFYFGAVTFTPGVRLETYRQTNHAVVFDFGAVDETISARKTKFLPGAGVTYYGLPDTTLFAGVHRGFAPPRPDANLDPSIILDGDPYITVAPEVSTNYEAGLRTILTTGLQAEATVFLIDFKNQIVPGQAIGLPQTFANGGETRKEGLELAARADFGTMMESDHNVYVTVSYTNLFTAKFDSSLMSDGIDVRGNRTPYAPRHTLSLALGYEHPMGLNMRVGLDYVSDQFSDAANSIAGAADGQSGLISDQTTLNASVSYDIGSSGATIYARANNFADKTYIVSRVNGIHVNQPFQVIG